MNQKKVFFAIFLLLTIGISTQLQPAFRSLQARALTYDPRQFVKAGEEPDEPVKVNAQNKYRLSALKQVTTRNT